MFLGMPHILMDSRLVEDLGSRSMKPRSSSFDACIQLGMCITLNHFMLSRPKAGLNSDMPSWQDWRRIVLPLVRPSVASEPPSSAGSAHGSTGSSIADGQGHTPKGADVPSIDDLNQTLASALKGRRERGAAVRRAREQAREQTTAAAQGAILEI